MSETTTTPGAPPTSGPQDRADLFRGLAALTLGLAALLGGGVLGTASQWLLLSAEGSAGTLDDLFSGLAWAAPSLVGGVAAVLLGGAAARSRHDVAAASARVGVLLGVLALAGGLLLTAAVASGSL